VGTTGIEFYFTAQRAVVYRALLDPQAIQAWRVPRGMTSVVHAFEAREGGRFRVSLTSDDPARAGKTGGQTDTYQGHFARLVPDREVVEVLAFETDDPAMQGEMTITYTLTDALDGGTILSAVHARLPPGVSEAENHFGWFQSLTKLADLVEVGEHGPVWIAERAVVFVDPRGRRTPGRIAVAQPRQISEGEARCRIGLDGLSRVRGAIGADPLQALLLALQLMAGELDQHLKRGYRVVDPDEDDDVPLEAYFGALVPQAEADASLAYRTLIDALVKDAHHGQGQIASTNVRAGVWNRNASPTELEDQHAINELLRRLSVDDREIVASMLAKQFEAGIHQTLVALYENEVPFFDKVYEGSPFHDFVGRLADCDWPRDGRPRDR
jgi:uncharacterized protein YndB with AHSA1/START domain